MPYPKHLVSLGINGREDSTQEYAVGYHLTERELLDKLHNSWSHKYHHGPWEEKILNTFYYGIDIKCVVESTIHRKDDCTIWECKYRTNDLSTMPGHMLILAGKNNNNTYYDIIDYLKNKYSQYEVLELNTLQTSVLD